MDVSISQTRHKCPAFALNDTDMRVLLDSVDIGHVANIFDALACRVSVCDENSIVPEYYLRYTHCPYMDLLLCSQVYERLQAVSWNSGRFLGAVSNASGGEHAVEADL